MIDPAIAAAARRQHLDVAFAAFPDEIARAAGLVEEQVAAMAGLGVPAVEVPADCPAMQLSARIADSADAPLHRLGLRALGDRFREGSLDPVTLLEALLARIDRLDPVLNSFVLVDREGARSAAAESNARWAADAALGPLDGIPVGIKDVIDVAGMPTRCHSRVTSSAPVTRDAAVVAELRAAGALILGKLATHEFAIGGPAFDLPFPPARNPWNPDHHPGGSSSGAGAAVAAGLVPLAIGTDTAGSVRNPASACGVVGLKPGFGRLSVEGVAPLAWTLDHVGILARGVDDVAIAAAVLGIEGAAPGAARFGYVRHFHSRDMIASAEVAAALDGVARHVGATEITLPSLGDFALVNRLILQSEGFAIHADHLRARPEALSALTRAALLPGAFTAAETLAHAYRRRTLLTEAVDAAFAQVDNLITASSLEPACRIDDPAEIARTYMLQARSPFNVTGHPALAMAAGVSESGLPLSVQFVSRHGEEGVLLAAAAMWEGASPPIRAPRLG